jgi:HlyD family secretion protein
VVQREPKEKKAEQEDDGEEISVVFVIENGKARQQPVRTGISDETHVEILEGLKAGDKVVTGPYRALRDLDDGEAVQITTAEEDRKKDEGGASVEAR